MLFLSMAVTGVMGFFLPFNLLTVSVHSLVGFLFILAVGFHVKNNFRQLRGYFGRRSALILLLFVVGLITFILMQPAPVRAVIGLSSNAGPDPDRFEIRGKRLLYRYDPAPHYRMRLEAIGGNAFDAGQAPAFAIWIENRSGYHIRSLHHSTHGDPASQLPYWHYKRSEYLKYRKRFEEMTQAGRAAGLDAMSSATENDSFEAADYIVPRDPEREAPYRVMIEINQAEDGNEYHEDQPSLVYSVEVDNRDPRTFQVLELVGYPRAEERDGELHWDLHFIDETITSAFELIDSALLQIERDERPTP